MMSLWHCVLLERVFIDRETILCEMFDENRNAPEMRERERSYSKLAHSTWKNANIREMRSIEDVEKIVIFFFCYYLFETAVHQLEFLAAKSCVQPGKKKRESDIEF